MHMGPDYKDVYRCGYALSYDNYCVELLHLPVAGVVLCCIDFINDDADKHIF